jgi:lysophospholipase L1-like esterase
VTLPTPVRNPEVNQILKQLREVYRQVAESMNVPVVDLTPRISRGDGLIADEFTNDGVHLNSDVYQMWSEELQKATQKE